MKKEMAVLNDTLNQVDLIDIFKAFHSISAEYTFFSSVHGTFPRRKHVLGHKTSLSKFKKIEVISSIFSNHNGINLEINQNTEKHKDMEAK